MATRGQAALLGTSTLTLVSNQLDGPSRIVARYEHGHWRRLPPPSARGEMFFGPGQMYTVQQDLGTLAEPVVNASGPQMARYIDGTADHWQSAPAYQLAQSPPPPPPLPKPIPSQTLFSFFQLPAPPPPPPPPPPFPYPTEPTPLLSVVNFLFSPDRKNGPPLKPNPPPPPSPPHPRPRSQSP